MPTQSNTRKQAIAEAITIEAWHKPFGKSQKVDLHIDIVFETARIGGEESSPVRFRLRMARAEVVLVLPETEPVSVDISSVARDATKKTVRLTETTLEDSRIKGNAGVGLSSSSGLSARVHAGAEKSLASKKKTEISSKTDALIVTQAKTPDGHYRWSIEAPSGAFLEGRPWDGVKRPRLKLIDTRKDPKTGIAPAVWVEVRCRREDIIIDDLQIKDKSLWRDIKHRLGFGNKMAAAESYIRDRLTQEGLQVKNIGEAFGELTLVRISPEQQS